MKHLTLSETGVLLQELHRVLLVAPRLESLTIGKNVDTRFPNKECSVPLLISPSLRIVHFEILSTGEHRVLP